MKYSVGEDNSSTTYLVSKDILVQNVQSVGIFQYEIFSKSAGMF
jgi:hypothetical protein